MKLTLSKRKEEFPYVARYACYNVHHVHFVATPTQGRKVSISRPTYARLLEGVVKDLESCHERIELRCCKGITDEERELAETLVNLLNKNNTANSRLWHVSQSLSKDLYQSPR